MKGSSVTHLKNLSDQQPVTTAINYGILTQNELWSTLENPTWLINVCNQRESCCCHIHQSGRNLAAGLDLLSPAAAALGQRNLTHGRVLQQGN